MINKLEGYSTYCITSFPDQKKKQKKQKNETSSYALVACYQIQKAQFGSLRETEMILRPFAAHLEAQKYFFTLNLNNFPSCSGIAELQPH